MSGNSKHPRSRRHIVFIGETGSGKSSAINLLLGTASAPISNDSRPCTDTSIPYEITLYGTTYCLWDSRGLGEGRSFFQNLFGGSSEKGLKKLLKERHSRQEIDLVVFCIRGSRATEAARDYYKKLCVPTRRLAAPVAVMVTQLEKEKDMDDWWRRNCLRLTELGMKFDDHTCITTLVEHPQLTESRKKLVDMISRDRRWEPEDSGSYFGSPVQKNPTTSASQRKGGIWGFLTGTTNGDIENRRRSDYPASFAPSTIESSYHTANSPAGSTLPSPVVEPPTPSSAATVRLPPINTQLLEVDYRPQSSGGDTSSRSSLSMFHPSSDSSCTSYSEVYLESCTEENEDSPTELPFKLSTSTVRRRRSWASRNGAFGDVWECDLVSGESTRIVAVKAVRINTSGSGHEDLRSHEKKLRRELKIWGKLRHKNIVPLLGVVSGFGPLPSTVLMPEKHRLLGDIAVGLRYLHSQDVVHGDLHSVGIVTENEVWEELMVIPTQGNVLIDDDGTACITDFGLSFISDFVGTSYLKSSICGGVSFADPALVKRAYHSRDNIFYPTEPCDIYSFGGLTLHVLSGKKPYDGIPPPNILVTVMRGDRPQIPTHAEHITHWHKSLIRACWAHEERKRPSADDLVRRFDRQ